MPDDAADPCPPDVLDRQRLASLRSIPEWGESCFSTAVRAFLKQTPTLMQEIRHAAASGDRAGLHRALHTLKGSSASLGLIRLVRSTEALRQHLNEDAASDHAPLIAEIALEAQYALGALNIELGIPPD